MTKESEKKAIEWWNNLNNKFDLLKKYGYQNEKKPWKYKPLTNKGIYMIWQKELKQTKLF